MKKQNRVPENPRTNAKIAQRKSPRRSYRLPLTAEERKYIEAAAKKRGLTMDEFAEKAVRAELGRGKSKRKRSENSLGAEELVKSRLTNSPGAEGCGTTAIASGEVPGAIFRQPRGTLVASYVRTGEIEWKGEEFSSALRAGRFLVTRVSPFAQAMLEREAEAGTGGGYETLLEILPKPELALLRGSTFLYEVSRFEPEQRLFVSLRGPLPKGCDSSLGQHSRTLLAEALQRVGIDEEIGRALDQVDLIFQSGDVMAMRMVDIFLRGLVGEIRGQRKGGAL